MDKDVVAIQNLQLPHGVVATNVWGKSKEQPVLVSVHLVLRNGFSSASDADTLDASTIHYGQLAKLIRGKSVPNQTVAALFTTVEEAVREMAGKRSGHFLVERSTTEVKLPKAMMYGGEGLSLVSILSFDEAGRATEVGGRAVVLEKCRLMALIGVNDYERSGKQPIETSIWLNLPPSAASGYASDKDTQKMEALFNIDQVLGQIIQETTFETLESLASFTIDRLQKQVLTQAMPGGTVQLKLAKPQAIPWAEAPFVEVFRVVPQPSTSSSSTRTNGTGNIVKSPIFSMRNLVLFTSVFATTALAQSNQGVLSFGSIPQCANQCAVLSSAATECGGGSSSSQAIWACFCQRVYSANPTAINSGSGLCTDTCPSTSDQSNTIDWFRSQCGDDNGASEHADSGSGGGSTNTQSSATSTSNPTSSATSTGGGSGSGASTDGNGILGENPSTRNWWSNHWQWIVMLIVLAVGLSLLAAGAIWFRKRRQRRADRITGSFNQGITSRSGNQNYGGEMSGPYGPGAGGKGIASGSLVDVDHSGRDSPMRTRDAFMPYGYNYTRSESRLASRGNVAAPSPGTADSTMVGTDEISMAGTESPYTMGGTMHGGKKESKKVLVRERSG